MLLAPGEESHTYEPTPADIVKIQQCDVFVYGGGESEKWVDEILASIDSDISVIKMMAVTDVCAQEHDHEDDEGEHEEYDEHVWTSPVKAKDIVNAITQAVCFKDSENEAYYKSNTRFLLESLNRLDEKFKSLSEELDGTTVIIGDRFPLRYLMLEYGIDYKAAFPGCSAQVEVNPVTLTQLIDFMNSEGVKKVFKIDLSSGNVALSISESTGAVVDTLYSCHVISAEDYENGENYLSLMQHNYDALKTLI